MHSRSYNHRLRTYVLQNFVKVSTNSNSEAASNLKKVQQHTKEVLNLIRNKSSTISLNIQKNLKNINTTEIRNNLQNYQQQTKGAIQNLNKWYMKTIGLDEVKKHQDRVVQLQEDLLSAQEKRRQVSNALAEIRSKSNELQEEIHRIKRQDDLQRFLELMKEETEMLKKERETSAIFSECDRAEREIFTAFTNAVRDSHEAQRVQLEYTKYFGLIISIVGSFLTFCYSTLRKNDLKKFIEQNLISSPITLKPIVNNLDNAQKELHTVAGSVSNVIKDQEVVMEKINLFNKQLNVLLDENSRVLRTATINHVEVKSMLETINNNIGNMYFKINNKGSDTNSSFEMFNFNNESRFTTKKVLHYGLIGVCCCLMLKGLFT